MSISQRVAAILRTEVTFRRQQLARMLAWSRGPAQEDLPIFEFDEADSDPMRRQGLAPWVMTTDQVGGYSLLVL
jgi:hypothetical protein